jgi:hypothetical protein
MYGVACSSADRGAAVGTYDNDIPPTCCGAADLFRSDLVSATEKQGPMYTEQRSVSFASGKTCVIVGCHTNSSRATTPLIERYS